MENIILENKIKVLIHGKNSFGLEIEEADCSFTTEFNDEKEPNSCKLRIYNLKQESMDAVIENAEYFEIFTNQYGAKDTDGTTLWQTAFAGLLRQSEKKTKSSSKKSKKPKKIRYNTPAITPQEDEADDYILVELQEGTGVDIGTFISKSYRAGFNVKKVLIDIAKSIDMEIVFDPNVKNFTVPFAIILHDNARNNLCRVASYIDARCTIENNRIHIVSNNPSGTTIYFQFDEENIQQPKYLQDKKIQFTAPYMPSVIVGSFVKLINKKMGIDGVYEVCKVENSFSNYSEECETTITVKY